MATLGPEGYRPRGKRARRDAVEDRGAVDLGRTLGQRSKPHHSRTSLSSPPGGYPSSSDLHAVDGTTGSRTAASSRPATGAKLVRRRAGVRGWDLLPVRRTLLIDTSVWINAVDDSSFLQRARGAGFGIAIADDAVLELVSGAVSAAHRGDDAKYARCRAACGKATAFASVPTQPIGCHLAGLVGIETGPTLDLRRITREIAESCDVERCAPTFTRTPTMDRPFTTGPRRATRSGRGGSRASRRLSLRMAGSDVVSTHRSTHGPSRSRSTRAIALLYESK